MEYNNATTKRNLQLQFQKPTIENIIKQKILKNETTVECIKRILGIDITQCPVCKQGTMHKIKTIPSSRSPDNNLPFLLVSLLD